jgi:hypothetical protein
MTLCPWSKGLSLVWDFTCVDTFAASHISKSKQAAGSAALTAEAAKITKYSKLAKQYLFTPVAIETLGSWGPLGLSFIKEVGKRITRATSEPRSTQFLLQRLSIAVQRGNADSILASLPSGDFLHELAGI